MGTALQTVEPLSQVQCKRLATCLAWKMILGRALSGVQGLALDSCRLSSGWLPSEQKSSPGVAKLPSFKKPVEIASDVVAMLHLSKESWHTANFERSFDPAHPSRVVQLSDPRRHIGVTKHVCLLLRQCRKQRQQSVVKHSLRCFKCL